MRAGLAGREPYCMAQDDASVHNFMPAPGRGEGRALARRVVYHRGSLFNL